MVMPRSLHRTKVAASSITTRYPSQPYTYTKHIPHLPRASSYRRPLPTPQSPSALQKYAISVPLLSTTFTT